MSSGKKRMLWALWATALVLALGALLCSPGVEVLQTSAMPPTGYVALTFDDGPWPGTTEALLDGLAERGVHATFFLVGSQIAGKEDLVLRMEEAGHQVGIHTWEHVLWKGMTGAEVQGQLESCRTCLEALLGPREFMVRPPYGFVNSDIKQSVQAPVICWSVDPEDWKDKKISRIVDAVLKDTKDGSIVLLHDIFPTSVEAALQCADALLDRGCCLVTVEELFAQRGVTPENGHVYRCLPAG